MKTIAIISGAFSLSVSGIGILFKIMHWPGASIILILGLGAFSLVFIPSLAKYINDKLK